MIPKARSDSRTLATAYQVLSDVQLRHKYNEFGASTPGLVPEDGFVDPEEVFGSLFGGKRFQDIIGTISIGKDMKEALQQDSEDLERAAENEEKEQQQQVANGEGGGESNDGKNVTKKGDSVLTPEQKAAKEEKERKRDEERAKHREERVSKLAETLIRKLSIYTESVRNANDTDLERQVQESFREITRLEAEELKQESYGGRVATYSWIRIRSKVETLPRFDWGLSGASQVSSTRQLPAFML